MIITNSNLQMASSRKYSEYSATSMTVSNKIPDSSGTSLGFFQNYLNQPLRIQRSADSKAANTSLLTLELLLLHRIFDSIAGRGSLTDKDMFSVQTGSLIDLRADTDNSGLTVGTVWQRQTTTNTFYSERESTTFSSTGYANTADGRMISFNVELSLSRSFTAEYSSFETADYVVTDPLMIDLESNAFSVSNVKFLFDLDQDGEKEEISFADNGSGFLALDKNNDGMINDGSELFGTKSGDGFADLSEYDEDGNGWIDEADSIFDKLRIWTRDENGKDRLISLKEADVGAICLGHSQTQFSLTDEANRPNAILRSTGIYLKESGGTGLIGQVDLTS